MHAEGVNVDALCVNMLHILAPSAKWPSTYNRVNAGGTHTPIAHRAMGMNAHR